MKRLLLFFVVLSPLAQAKVVQCPEGEVYSAPVGTNQFECRPLSSIPGFRLDDFKCQDPKVGMFNPKGHPFCLELYGPEQQIQSFSKAHEECVYIEKTKENNKSTNTSVNKCPSPILNNEAVAKCGIVDSRCEATLICHPTPVGFIDGSNFGVNMPSYEVEVKCPSVGGKCPEDPMDCYNNTEIMVKTEDGFENARRQWYRSRRVQQGGDGSGVR